MSFFRLSDLSHMQDQARSMPSTQAVARSPSHNRDGSEKIANVRQDDPSPQPLRSSKICERLVVTARSTARSCRSMSSYGRVLAASSRVLAASSRVLAASSRVLAARSEAVYFFRSNLCRFRSKFAYWALPLSLSSPWTMIFFLRNDKYGQEVKMCSKCPTSGIDSPPVRYVKGC